jgi:hypothetical protein
MAECEGEDRLAIYEGLRDEQGSTSEDLELVVVDW